MNNNIYELHPTNGRKSFYGKALIRKDADGSETLLSYNTPIIRRERDGSLVRLWSGWSMTTGTHIAAFCGLGKAAFCAMEVKD